MQAHEDGLSERPASPSFWLRRCSSAPMPSLVTPEGGSGAHDEYEFEILQVLSRDCSGEYGRSEIPLKSTSSHSNDEYPPDKENCQTGSIRRKSLSWDGRQSACRSPSMEEDRQPFAELQADFKWLEPVFSPSLASSPDSETGSRSRTLGLPPPQRPATSAMV